jgi:hypothetical protein
VTSSANESPFLLTKSIETTLNGIISPIDIYELDRTPRKIVTDMRRRITDARLDTRDYELSETRDQQLKNASLAKKRLEQVRKDILAASEYNIFSSVDVAQLTATVDHIIERLE